MECKHENWDFTPYSDSNKRTKVRKVCLDCKQVIRYGMPKSDLKDGDIITFGKYKSQKLIDVYNKDLCYLKWVTENIPNKFSKQLGYYLQEKANV